MNKTFSKNHNVLVPLISKYSLFMRIRMMNTCNREKSIELNRIERKNIKV